MADQTTLSSPPDKSPTLSPNVEKALKILGNWTPMDAGRTAGPAIRDLGILNPQGWAGSTEKLGVEILDELRSSDRWDFYLKAAQELEEYSAVGRDPAHIAIMVSRIAAVVVFLKRAISRGEAA